MWPRMEKAQECGQDHGSRLSAMEAPSKGKDPLPEVSRLFQPSLPQCRGRCRGLLARGAACGCDQSVQGGEGDADPGPQPTGEQEESEGG